MLHDREVAEIDFCCCLLLLLFVCFGGFLGGVFFFFFFSFLFFLFFSFFFSFNVPASKTGKLSCHFFDMLVFQQLKLYYI